MLRRVADLAASLGIQVETLMHWDAQEVEELIAIGEALHDRDKPM